jgi:hypothetical protein
MRTIIATPIIIQVLLLQRSPRKEIKISFEGQAFSQETQEGQEKSSTKISKNNTADSADYSSEKDTNSQKESSNVENKNKNDSSDNKTFKLVIDLTGDHQNKNVLPSFSFSSSSSSSSSSASSSSPFPSSTSSSSSSSSSSGSSRRIPPPGINKISSYSFATSSTFPLRVRS